MLALNDGSPLYNRDGLPAALFSTNKKTGAE